MSHIRRHATELEERDESPDQPRSPFADVAGRFANWISGMDRVPDREFDGFDEPESDPFRALAAGMAPPVADDEGPSRFPVAALGYDRDAVDRHLAALERELEELRAAPRQAQPMTITEELERIGEQTASILVVAHDNAHKTTRRAQEEAERCIADAAANAAAMTQRAQKKLAELDAETDAVWHERERLLEDMRAVSAALASLADQASERFPAAEPQTGSPATGAFPARAPMRGAATVAAPERPSESQDTDSFEPIQPAMWEMTAEPEEAVEAEADPNATQEWDGLPVELDHGDTASWLAGFEPPPAGGDAQA